MILEVITIAISSWIAQIPPRSAARRPGAALGNSWETHGKKHGKNMRNHGKSYENRGKAGEIHHLTQLMIRKIHDDSPHSRAWGKLWSSSFPRIGPAAGTPTPPLSPEETWWTNRLSRQNDTAG